MSTRQKTSPKNSLDRSSTQLTATNENDRRLIELEHLHKTAEKLASVAELPDVLRQIVKSARDVLQADSTVIWSYDAVREVFLPTELVAEGIEQKILEKFRNNVPRHEGTAAHVLKRGYLEVTDVDDLQYGFLSRPLDHGLRETIGVKSFQGIALRVEGEPVGVLYVNYKLPHAFDKRDKSTLEAFAYFAALALKKARLLGRLRKVHESARIIAEASVLENLQVTLKAIAKGTQDALYCDAVTLYTYNQEKNEIGFPPVMIGVIQETDVLKYKFLARDSIIYDILGRDEMYVAEDVSSAPAMKNQPFVKREGIKSLVSLPLKVSNHKVGVMFVNFRHAHYFTREERADIELFADQAAVVIRNAQLYEDVTKTTKYLQAFYDAGKAMSGTLALDEILDRITKQAQLITGHTSGSKARFSYLALVDGNKLKMMSAFPASYLQELQRVLDNLDFEHDEHIGITGRAFMSGETQLVGNVKKHPDYVPGDLDTISELAVPIKSNEKVIGVIDVEHSNYDAFDEDDKQALEALAAQAAIAIQYARLFEVTERRAAQLTAASKVARDAAAILDVKQLLDRTVKLISEYFNFYHAGIFLLDDKREYAVLMAASSAGSQRLIEQRYKLEVGKIGIVGHVASTGKPRIALDVGKNAYFFNNPVLPDTHSEIALPMRAHSQLIGVLDVQSTAPNAFTEDDKTVLQTMVDHLAIAIENARHFEDLKQIKNFVGSHTAIEWMRMVGNVWGHSIKREVGMALVMSELTRQALNKGDMEKALGELERLEEVVMSIGKIPFTTPLSAEDAVSSVSINRIIRDYLAGAWSHAQYKDVELILNLQPDLDEIATVRASEGWLRRGFEILVENAVQAMIETDSPTKKLKVSTLIRNDEIEILFCDTGPGIPDAVVTKVFEKGEPLNKPKGSRGAGVGLLIARTIFDAYQGRLFVREVSPSGTIMAVTLPTEKKT